MPGSANKKQIGGNHYTELVIQPWDYIVSNNIPFLEGNAIKYLTRWREKGGIADIEKAQHYIEKLLEVEHKREVLPTFNAPPKSVESAWEDYLKAAEQGGLEIVKRESLAIRYPICDSKSVK